MTDAQPAPAWRPRPEHELIPYRALAPLGLRSIVVLAPHPDDEVFGCGGLLALAVQQGVSVRVVVVSDGAAGGDAAARERESRAAAEVLGYGRQSGALEFWRLPDRGVVADARLVDRIRALCGEDSAHWLMAPSPFEVHPDHRAVCLAATEAAGRAAAQLVYYEIGQPLMPDLLVDISAVTPHKRDAMRCFASQLVQQDYGEHVTALNRYRSYTLGPGVTHAEAFWRAPAGASLEDVFGEARALLGRRFSSALPPSSSRG
jgi:LmbE family N-acetylglucosaminyl deacetylase